MSWLQSLDTALFRFINLKLSNPVLDAIMPQFAGNAWFIPAAILLAVWLVWKGGVRGRLFVLMITLVLALGDGFVATCSAKLSDSQVGCALDATNSATASACAGGRP